MRLSETYPAERYILGHNLASLAKDVENIDLNAQDREHGRSLFRTLTEKLKQEGIQFKANPNQQDYYRHTFCLGNISINTGNTTLKFNVHFQKIGDQQYIVDLISEANIKEFSTEYTAENIATKNNIALKSIVNGIFNALNAQIAFHVNTNGLPFTRDDQSKTSLKINLLNTPHLMTRVEADSEVARIIAQSQGSITLSDDKVLKSEVPNDGSSFLFMDETNPLTHEHFKNQAMLLNALGFKNNYYQKKE